MEEKDTMLELCIKQGYVPSTCTLNGILVFGLVNKGEDPCSGCNCNRDICKGRDKALVYNEEFLIKQEQEYKRKTIEEKNKIKRQKKHLSVSKLHRLMEVSYEYRNGVEVIIKDLINEKAYCIKKIESFKEAERIIIHYIRQFQIQQIHIELNGGLEIMYDELIDIFEKENIDCDIISFKYIPLRENTELYNDMPKNNNFENFSFYKE